MKYIFVDVDGVLNPLQLRSGGFRHLALPNGPSGPGFYLNLHRVYGQWLVDLAESTNSCLVWGSTWQEYANKWIGQEIGLPELPWLDLTRGKMSESLGSIKAKAALEYAQGEDFVFFDDEFDLHHFLKGRKGRHIHVNPQFGLTRRLIIEAQKHLSRPES